MGLGGAILNYGNLFINLTELSGNYAHRGGAIKRTLVKLLLFHQ